jgi:dipeptidyl aminopeptidase/acylaminoacyl peptidase
MGHSILIYQGGKISVYQGKQEAFQAAQLRGIKSRFIYFPEENHWVLSLKTHKFGKKNFFKWLKETL